MDIYKESKPVILDAVQDTDGVFRVPPIVERTEWKVHYRGFSLDSIEFNNITLRKFIMDKMREDIEKMNRDLFRTASS